MEEQDQAVSPQGALSSFALTEAADSMKHNLHLTNAYWEDLMQQMAAVEDQSALIEVMQEDEQELNKIIDEEQVHRAQISVLSHGAAGHGESWGAKSRKWDNLVPFWNRHRGKFIYPYTSRCWSCMRKRTSLSSRYDSHASLPSQSPAAKHLGLHEEMFDILPGTVNTVRGAASRVRQIPNVVASNPSDGSLEEILTKADHQIQGMSIAGPKRVRCTDT